MTINKNNVTIAFCILIFLTIEAPQLQSQELTQDYIQVLKEDRRGPYKDIKWFCEDGTIREARDPCPEPLEGVQHARHKDRVVQIGKQQHIFLDQILTGEDIEAFWDESNQQSRLKQYQLTNFLYNYDDGWINRKGKFYRGAKQIEDEKEWGQSFFEWVVSSDARVNDHFLLLRNALTDVPYGEDNASSQGMRAYSKLLADSNEGFMDLRIKIHNNPQTSDLTETEQWLKANNAKLNEQEREYGQKLIKEMTKVYKSFNYSDLKDILRFLPEQSSLYAALKVIIDDLPGYDPYYRALALSKALPVIREKITQTEWHEARLKLLSLTNDIERQILKDISGLQLSTIDDIRYEMCYLLDAIYGAGYITEWEYLKVLPDFDWMAADTIALGDLLYYQDAMRKVLQWSTQMIQSLYIEPINKFTSFEPEAKGLIDDKVRSSLLLRLGNLLEQNNRLLEVHQNQNHSILDIKSVSGIHGLNPGIAKGVFEVITENDKLSDLKTDHIYAFHRPPGDLGPVAGILNVEEGNPVSHVQLLARNLGIPNAVITSDLLNRLEDYSNQEMFYAVSHKGTLVMKKVEDMTDVEKDLFKQANPMSERFTISTDQLVLGAEKLLNLNEVDASFSGKWCGPKAANLGQLKKMYPDKVVDGVVLPFGIFKDHMNQTIPGRDLTYWQFLQKIFEKERSDIKSGVNQSVVEKQTLAGLSELRGLIETMPLKSGLVRDIENGFLRNFGTRLGKVPVFLRSDTNMEDLPNFTGAGLNLTLFNVLDREEILNGIKKVWASPYTERSYRWRQRVLNNPEEVYPSILIIPSVNVDCSGVVITKGVTKGGDGDISVSFSKGVGGAVDGQSAESYVLYKNGYDELIAPSRETKYKAIPTTGGTTTELSNLNNPVLDESRRKALREISNDIASKMDQITNNDGPYDIELGFKQDKIWLFQVRPFVENKGANSSNYLKELDPEQETRYVILDKVY